MQQAEYVDQICSRKTNNHFIGPVEQWNQRNDDNKININNLNKQCEFEKQLFVEGRYWYIRNNNYN